MTAMTALDEISIFVALNTYISIVSTQRAILSVGESS